MSNNKYEHNHSYNYRLRIESNSFLLSVGFKQEQSSASELASALVGEKIRRKRKPRKTEETGGKWRRMEGK